MLNSTFWVCNILRFWFDRISYSNQINRISYSNQINHNTYFDHISYYNQINHNLNSSIIWYSVATMTDDDLLWCEVDDYQCNSNEWLCEGNAILMLQSTAVAI